MDIAACAPPRTAPYRRRRLERTLLYRTVQTHLATLLERAADSRPGLERLLRYCARPAFALERLREIDAEHLVYESVKPGPGGSVSLMPTPLELIEAPGGPDPAAAPHAAAEPALRQAARYAWALLLARIYEAFPLLCPKCGGAMRIVAFITETAVVRDLLAHLGEPIAPPRMAPAYKFDQPITWGPQAVIGPRFRPLSCGSRYGISV